MSKQIKLNIEVDETGKIIATPEGTQGPECIDIMRFLDYIEGFEVEETVKTDKFHDKKVQIVGKQQSKRK